MTREIVFEEEIVIDAERHRTIEIIITKKKWDDATNTYLYELWIYQRGWQEQQPKA